MYENWLLENCKIWYGTPCKILTFPNGISGFHSWSSFEPSSERDLSKYCTPLVFGSEFNDSWDLAILFEALTVVFWCFSGVEAVKSDACKLEFCFDFPKIRKVSMLFSAKKRSRSPPLPGSTSKDPFKLSKAALDMWIRLKNKSHYSWQHWLWNFQSSTKKVFVFNACLKVKIMAFFLKGWTRNSAKVALI